MLGKRPRPMIGKLSELLISGNNNNNNNKPRSMDVVGTTRSPRSPLDIKTPSPRGLKWYDAGHGVGLGIVAALDNKSICSSDLNRSNAILINPCKTSTRGRQFGDSDLESLEDYTYVTSHGHGPGGKSSSTKVYYDGATATTTRHDTKGFGAVKETPIPAAKMFVDYNYPTSDFLSCCHLCRKQLHGKDIYMYR